MSEWLPFGCLRSVTLVLQALLREQRESQGSMEDMEMIMDELLAEL